MMNDAVSPSGTHFRYLAKDFEPFMVVWFEAANQWVQFDATQKRIFMGYAAGLSPDQLLAQRNHNEVHATPTDPSLVENMYHSLDQIVEGVFPLPDFTIDAPQALHHQLPTHKTHHYRYRQKHFSIRYANPFLQAYIHLPFAHLETQHAPPGEGLFLEVFPFGGRFAMRINRKHCLTTDESPQLKRLVYVQLSEYLYGMQEHQWLCRLHASAVVSPAGRLVVLTSVSGGGKSTMTALLQKAGFHYFADDYIPVSRGEQLLYPFPAALSVKKGSWDMLKGEGIVPNLTNKYGAGYLTPPDGYLDTAPRPVSEIIFIRWEKDAPLQWQPVDPMEALYLLLQETWVNSTPEGAAEFIDWFSGLRFYRLTYSDNEEGVGCLKG